MIMYEEVLKRVNEANPCLLDGILKRKELIFGPTLLKRSYARLWKDRERRTWWMDGWRT